MNTDIYVRTDLACERRRADTTLDGVSYEETQHGPIIKSTLCISDAQGASSIGKPCGTYVTLSFRPLWELDDAALTKIAALVCDTITDMLPKRPSSDPRTVLVTGLGNLHLTVDAVGPLSTQRILATSHLAVYEPALFHSLGCDKLAVFTPGVLSQTGIESAALIAGAVKASCPDVVIVIDALVARSCRRLAATVQISNTGILPGAGVGNPRAAIDQESLGVPVIVIGIPTVVDAATLIYDALTNEGAEELPENLHKTIESNRGYFVSPRECDAVTDNAARLISHALNMAFGIGVEGAAE